MNTLSKDLTRTLFESSDGYDGLVRFWSGLMADKVKRKTLRAEHHLLYAAARGKNWRRGFTAATNPRKLESGYHPETGAINALARVNYPYRDAELLEPFEGHFTPVGLSRLRRLLPDGLTESAYREVQMA